MSDNSEDETKSLTLKGLRSGYVDYFNETIGLIRDSKHMTTPEAFEYLNKIVANALDKEKVRKSEGEKYGIDLEMSDDDVWKPSPPRY